MKLRGSEIALIGVLASLIIMAGYIPLMPIVGTNYTFSLGSVLIHIIAIVTGPILGGITVVIGSFSGMILTGQGLQLLFFIPATIGAVVTGLLVWNKYMEGLALYACTILLWYLTPVGREVWYYPYLHMVVLLLLIVSRPYIKNVNKSSVKNYFLVLILFCSCGILTDHLLGSFLALFPPFELPASAYKFILYIYPVERIFIGVASAVVAVPVLNAIQNSSLSIIKKDEEPSPRS